MSSKLAAPGDAPPAFDWDRWYAGVGGRRISIPEVDALLREIYDEQWPRFSGPVAQTRPEIADIGQMAAAIKQRARELGADIVGVCEVEPSDLYRGREVEHRYAIVLGARMRWAAFQTVPSHDSAIECIRVYASLGETCIGLANHVRGLGWAAEVEHPIGDSNVLHIPLALKAGFGELGRHGSIIHPELGPLFRMGSVLTSLPMATDAPIDAGIAAFCDKCKACRVYCPADAIPDERDPTAGRDHLGNHRYRVDTGKCFPYFAEHEYCSACLPACVYNHRTWARDFGGAETAKYPDVQMHDPPPPHDGVPAAARHEYPRIHRDGVVPLHALRKRKK